MSQVRPLLACLCALSLLTACSTGDLPQRGTQPSVLEPPTASGGGFSLVATGDVLIHPALTDQATEDGNGKRDYRALFAGVKPVLSQADLAICHLETPLAMASGPFKGYPEFSAPPEIAAALADAGYDDCSTASNHTLDMGDAGVTRTLDALDGARIRHTGSARSSREAGTPLLLDVAGVKLGHLSYTFGFNGKTLPDGKPWLSNTIDPGTILTAARAARKAGAAIVVVSLHWGTEYVAEPTAEQRRVAQQLLADPAIDLIIGHHAHVVQPFERINGKWVAYGLGNHVARHSDPRGVTEEGAIARFHFHKSGSGWTVDRAEYLPTLVDLGPPIRVRDLSSGTGSRRDQALQRVDKVILSRGAAAQGLTRP
jgi:poly-gamma-glutamate synthesis protein (capsule biosynthesis protein)